MKQETRALIISWFVVISTGYLLVTGQPIGLVGWVLGPLSLWYVGDDLYRRLNRRYW